jgi:hypothetical protein
MLLDFTIIIIIIIINRKVKSLETIGAVYLSQYRLKTGRSGFDPDRGKGFFLYPLCPDQL